MPHKHWIQNLNQEDKSSSSFEFFSTIVDTQNNIDSNIRMVLQAEYSFIQIVVSIRFTIFWFNYILRHEQKISISIVGEEKIIDLTPLKVSQKSFTLISSMKHFPRLLLFQTVSKLDWMPTLFLPFSDKLFLLKLISLPNDDFGMTIFRKNIIVQFFDLE